MLFIFLLVGLVIHAQAEPCTTPNNEKAECIPLTSCPILQEAEKDPNLYGFLALSACGSRLDDGLVCCGTAKDFIETDNPFADEDVCGLQHSDDYLHSDTPVLTDFPWVALIGYGSKHDGSNTPLQFNKRYKCSGSLINKRYVLTSARCLTRRHETPISVRLGEFNVVNTTDCIQDSRVTECSDDVQDFEVERLLPHPRYNKATGANNIGLIKLQKTVMYTDYIRPICLPSPNKVKAKAGSTLTIAGWGTNYTNTETKKVTYVTLGTDKMCRGTFSGVNAVTTNSAACGLPKDEPQTCRHVNEGDAVMFSHKNRWHQEGILTLAKCETYLPWMFTKVENYLNWIKDTIDS